MKNITSVFPTLFFHNNLSVGLIYTGSNNTDGLEVAFGAARNSLID